MAIFPSQVFTGDNVALRTGLPSQRAPYRSRHLGHKFVGRPRGAWLGFIASALGPVLTLAVDPVTGRSVLKVDSDGDAGGMDVVIDSNITLDFSSSLASEFLPDGIQVIARVTYDNTGVTVAQIVPRTKTTVGVLVHTVGATPATLDLADIAPDGAIEPGSISISVDVDGSGPDTITDDGAGNMSSTGTALSGGGTVNYNTGVFSGTTTPLTALSSVLLTHTRGVGKNEVLLCEVTGTPAAIAVSSTAPATRTEPIADAGVPYGFMDAGSIEALAAAVEILNEVVAARTDLQGVAHPDLKTRLDTDLGSTAMAFRLGRTLRVLRSNTYAVTSGLIELNVSGSFTGVNRDHEPKIDLDGIGSETETGVVAAPVDAVRNVCITVDADSGARLLTDLDTRTVSFGRLIKTDDFILDGVLSFTNALTTVTGDSAAQFLDQLEVGDTILGADGRFYEVADIPSATSLNLVDAYQGATASTGGVLRRRITLQFRSIASGVEQNAPLVDTGNVEFFFPAFVTHGQSNFDTTAFLHKPGERPAVPDASTTVSGKIALADAASPFVGSINLQERGTPVPGGPFHTLNLLASAGNVFELSPGVVSITNLGPTGPPGPGAGPGPPGDPGDPGPSYNSLSSFELDSEISLSPAQVTVTHTVNFGFDIGFLSGGIARFRDGGTFATLDEIEIDDIRLDSAQIATIEARGGAVDPIDSFVVLYLDAAGTV